MAPPLKFLTALIILTPANILWSHSFSSLTSFSMYCFHELKIRWRSTWQNKKDQQDQWKTWKGLKSLTNLGQPQVCQGYKQKWHKLQKVLELSGYYGRPM